MNITKIAGVFTSVLTSAKKTTKPSIPIKPTPKIDPEAVQKIPTSIMLKSFSPEKLAQDLQFQTKTVKKADVAALGDVTKILRAKCSQKAYSAEELKKLDKFLK